MRLVQSNKGFTLIEVLLVTSIVSLLSSVVVSQSQETRLRAQDTHMKIESNHIANAVRLYKEDRGNAPYPLNYSSQIGEVLNESEPAYRDAMQQLVSGGYISEIPASPSGESYSYLVTADLENAMFVADLNFESNSSSGGSGGSSNSCDFIHSETTYGSCTQVYGTNTNTPQGQVYTPPSCSTASYNPQDSQCFEVENSDINLNCDCVNWRFASDNVSYPNDICDSVPQFTNYGICTASITGEEVYVCGIDVEEVPCVGNSNQEYCSCI